MCVSRVLFFCPNTWFLRQIPVIIRQSLRAPLQMACFLRQIPCLGAYLWMPSCPSIVRVERGCFTREARCAKLVAVVDSNRWSWSGVCETILAWEIYCANPNPVPDSHSGSWVFKVIGTQSPRSIRYNDLASLILIRPLTQPLTCKMGS